MLMYDSKKNTTHYTPLQNKLLLVATLIILDSSIMIFSTRFRKIISNSSLRQEITQYIIQNNKSSYFFHLTSFFQSPVTVTVKVNF